jgi:hypothetical protein
MIRVPRQAPPEIEWVHWPWPITATVADTIRVAGYCAHATATSRTNPTEHSRQRLAGTGVALPMPSGRSASWPRSTAA